MRSLPQHGSTIGGVGWRVLATTDELANATTRFGAPALAVVEQQAPSGHMKIGDVKFPIHPGESAEDALRRLEWLSYAGPPVK